MAVFLIVPTGQGPGSIEKNLENMLAGQFYKLPQGQFLVKYTGTSKSLSDALGITDGASGPAVVASLSGYHGRAPTDIWEWMKQHWGES